MKLRVGLIGLGEAWQQRHRPALRMLDDRFDVRAIYSSVSLLADHAAKDFQACRLDGFRQLVRRRDIDAVLILEKSWQGWLPMLAACEEGKAIYWAADLDFAAPQAVALKQRVDRSGVAFMAEFPRRCAPATLRLKELIATRLGPPQLIFCHRRLPTVNPATARQRFSRRASGEIATPSADRELVEMIDWCRYVVARDPAAVTAIEHASQTSRSYRNMTLHFAGEAETHPVTAQLSCGQYIPAQWQEAIGFRPPSGMQICCERGVAFVDLPSSVVWFDEAGRHVESLESELPVGERLLTQFHRAVTSLVRKMGDLNDACRASQIVLAASQSADAGQRIELEFGD
jgi:predicted dehydrogenase